MSNIMSYVFLDFIYEYICKARFQSKKLKLCPKYSNFCSFSQMSYFLFTINKRAIQVFEVDRLPRDAFLTLALMLESKIGLQKAKHFLYVINFTTQSLWLGPDKETRKP